MLKISQFLIKYKPKSLACFLFTTTLIFFNFLVVKDVTAQIVPDTTLPDSSTVKIDENFTEITGGTRRGANLFHSFEKFSLPQGEAFFNNAHLIKNIITRVTGSHISNINGILRANGTANLFLLNPNGFIFGSNAQLNIGGSFFATTAERLFFADGTEFSAIDPYNSSVLTVTVPVGLGFNKNPGAIQVQDLGHRLIGSPVGVFPLSNINNPLGLQVNSGQTLALIGGDVKLKGGILSATSGRVEIGSVDSGFVSLNTNNSAWNIGYEKISAFRDVQLSQQSLVEASGNGQNSIQIQGKNINLTSGSVVYLQNQGFLPDDRLDVRASDSLSIRGLSLDRTIRSGLITETLAGGKGGDLTVSTQQLMIENWGGIATSTYGSGQGGNIKIATSDRLQIFGTLATIINATTSISSLTLGEGKGGNVNIFSEELTVKNQGFIGTIVGFLNFRNRKLGSGGKLNIFSKNLFISNGGNVGTLTFANSQGGDATINANNSVELVGINLLSFPSVLNVATFNTGTAGNLTINTSKLIVRDGARVNTTTLAKGQAGNLNINASEFIEVKGEQPGLINPSLIDSSANIVDGQDDLGLPQIPSGNAGTVTINTPQLIVSDKASVTVRNDGTGNAGTLEINALSIFLNNSGSISATTASGRGGDIEINSSDLRLNDNSAITATAGGTGDGGNITINTDTLTALENSNITANAFKGRGGNINITTHGIFFSPDSSITATSELGVDGTVSIEILQPLQQEPIVPNPTITTEQLLATSCIGRTEARGRFNYIGQSGLPLLPDSGFDSSGEAVKIPKPSQSVSVRHEDNPVASAKRPWQIGDPVVEPDSLVKTPDGQARFVNTSVSETPLSIEELICQPTSTQSGK